MMSPAERYRWIAEWIGSNEKTVDVLNKRFVDDYIDATGVNFTPFFYGAPLCKQLGRDLSEMFKRGILDRSRIGLPLMESGFPKWVY